MSLEQWVPMRWPCGPLDIEEARRHEGFTAADDEALQWWGSPGALEILAGTPVSCLVVTWAEGGDADEGHQRALAPLLGAARRRGLAVVGRVAASADLPRAAAGAAAAGLDAVVSPSGEPVPAGLDVLRFGDVSAAEGSSREFLGLANATWPGMRMPEGIRMSADAATGPTGPPWIDSNAWRVRLARDLMRPRTIWLSYEPPEGGRPLPPAAYLQAIADTEVYGARWVVSLDRRLRRGLARQEEVAANAWSEIARALAFFREHRGWLAYRPVSHLGVVSDFTGANEFMSFEVLNLLARQSSLYRIIERRDAVEAPLDGLQALLVVDEAAPSAELARRLYAFVHEGGTLITPPGWEQRGTVQEDAWPPRYRVLRYGAGRLAVAREEASDPLVLAQDAQLLLSHRHDAVRLYNAYTAMSHYSRSEDGRSGVLHLICFMGWFIRRPITVWTREPWASARVWRSEGWEGAALEASPGEPGAEFHPGPVPSYCALEVST